MSTIFVPEFPIYTPEWKWPEWTKNNKARVDKFVAAAIYGGDTGGLTTTITAARWLSDQFTTGPPTDENTFLIHCRGFANDSDYFNTTITNGSIAADTFDDNGGTSRTVEHVGYYEPDGLTLAIEDSLAMGWNGASIANDADTFYSIEVEDNVGGLIEYTRASATYDSSQSGMTLWFWEDIAHNSHFVVANNDADFIINLTA